ncbi:MAG TPA: hypothetical protein VJ801_18520 [Polyangia bacterium]|nr:hypothetical protein [Polyangia bacterium]
MTAPSRVPVVGDRVRNLCGGDPNSYFVREVVSNTFRARNTYGTDMIRRLDKQGVEWEFEEVTERLDAAMRGAGR